MTPRSDLPRKKVRALRQRVAAHLGLAAVGGVIAALGGLLISSWAVSGTVAWRRPSALPLVLWLVAGAIVGYWLWRLARRSLRWNALSAAAEIERRVALPPGTVQGAVEPGLERPGISRSLLELHRTRVAEKLQGLTVGQLGSGFARYARRAAAVTLALATVVLLASTAIWIQARESAADAWAAVLNPVTHLSHPPLPRLRLVAESGDVRRGRDWPVTVYAPQRDSVVLVWQPSGQVPNRRWYDVSNGAASAVVPRLDAPTRVWAQAPDGAVSDTLSVTPTDPLLLLDVRLTLSYPAHTERERELFSAPFPALAVPEGARAVITGTATRPLARAALRNASGGSIAFDITEDRRFRGSFRVRPGAWGWDIVGLQGAAFEGELDSLFFTTVPDSVPLVDVVYPGVDTVMSTDMVQPLVVEAIDDYGLSRVELISWRISIWGERWPEDVMPIELQDDGPRAELPVLLDARGRGFLPGDTLRYFVRAYDNAPDPQVGTSREYLLRLPALDELRDRAVSDANQLVDDAERLADRAREQQESARALERSSELRQQQDAGRRTPPGQQGVEFKDTEAARQAMEEAGQLLEEAEQVQESLRELQRSIEQAGLNDTSVLERLREIESLYERILTPELERMIEELREALADLDPEAIQEAIEQLAEGSVDFRERVEQSLELLRRAALETEFETLETEAEELSEAQDQLAEALTEAEPEAIDSLAPQLESSAEDLAERTENLAEEVSEFAEELREAGEQAAAEQAAQAQRSASGAARSDQQVARSMSADRQQAGESANRAAEQMEQAASALQRGRQDMQEDWRQRVVEALDRAQAEALEMARRQQELNQRLGSNDPAEREDVRSDEVAMKRGVDQLVERLSETAKETLLLDRDVVAAASMAGQPLEELLGQLADGTRLGQTDPQLGQQASEALNELAFRLMRASDDAAMAQSGTGMQEALEQLAQLADQQGQVNRQSGGMTPGAIDDMVLQQLRQLASRQRAIAQRLQEIDRSMGSRSQVLGQLESLGREAEDLARLLERGQLNPEVIERQNRLFQRLLDAGRTLEQDEFDRERQAERPGDVEILRPGPLAPDLLRGPQYPIPAEEALRRYPPAYRRLILEYFDRLNGREGNGGS